jgi:hypothetical protein
MGTLSITTRRARTRRGLTALALLAVLSACGTGPTLSSALASGDTPPPPSNDAAIAATKAKTPVWTPAPAIPGEKVYPGIGLRTLPAPTGVVPSINSASALKSPDVADFVARGLATGVPDQGLRLVTTGDFPPGSQTDGSVTKRLAWVLTYHMSPPDYRGGHNFAPPANPSVSCDFIIAVDAATSVQILAAQICPGT